MVRLNGVRETSDWPLDAAVVTRGLMPRKTVDDAFAEISALRQEVRDTAIRMVGFPDENFQGGKLGEIREQVEVIGGQMGKIGTGLAALNAQLPALMQEAVTEWQKGHDARTYTGMKRGTRWLLGGVAVSVFSGVVLALILALVNLPHPH